MIQNTYHLAMRMPRRAGSRSRHGRRLAALLSGLIILGAAAPATADPVGDGKTKTTMTVLEQLSALIQDTLDHTDLGPYGRGKKVVYAKFTTSGASPQKKLTPCSKKWTSGRCSKG
jgi:hypothetical protein